MERRLKVSFIEFLNSVPLGWGFLHGTDRGAFDLMFDVPSQCATHLEEGAADVGLIPVIEYQRIEGLRVLPGISIASRREVKSVLFVSRSPIEEVKEVAVDTSSRTSVALLKILLHRFYGRSDVSLHPHSPQPRRMLERYGSALVIGNPALRIPKDGVYVYDLANEWHRFTRLPFVFAFWAVRKDVELGSAREIFYRSREEGLANIDRIADHYSAILGLQVQEVEDYIRHNLHYDLDADNLAGLELFYQLAHELGLISEVTPLRFI
ncbi:MAG TPA: menaquinone biosynthesis protein [Acidobacteriota bacterium]|nr:menaquinone biosynthesis protein [Acidobacteriota bacterium]